MKRSKLYILSLRSHRSVMNTARWCIKIYVSFLSFYRVTLSTGEQTDQPDANEVDAEGSPLTVNSRSPSVNPDWRSDSGIVVTPEKGKRTALFYESTEAAATPSVVTPPSNVNPVSTSDSGPVVTPNKGHPTGLTYGPPETAATSSLITPGSIEPTKQTNIVLAVPNLVNSGHVPDRRSW